MKKYLLLLILVFLPMWICAEPVDVETARQNATEFIRNHSSARGKDMMPANKPLRLLHTQRQENDDAPTLYVFGNEGDDGYVVIAGDDAAVAPVLGYSKTGRFDADSIPCNIRYWLGEYSRQLAFARKVTSSIKQAPSNAPRESIAPLITTKWHQHAPFNNLCPTDPYFGEKSVTGCFATAMAQIMYYHKWPEQGVGSHSYEWEGQTLTADFGATTYQWNKMKDTYDVDDEDPDDAVATLMYHCGVASGIQYSLYGSAAWMNGDEHNLLVNYFNYSHSATQIWADKAKMLDAILYKELSAMRPVFFAGGGHAFICDGYDNGYFHFNFGWGGGSDDYYLLSAITPGYYDFSSDIYIIYSIQKPGKEYAVDNLLYELFPDNTAHLVQGNTENENIIVPSHIEVNGQDFEVTEIGNRAFADCSSLISISIPNSVTSIGDAAFSGCYLLGSIDNTITIPNSIQCINSSTFEGCYNMYSVSIPNSVTSIGNRAFANCSKLTSLTIPNSVTSIGDDAFYSCDGLTSIQIESGNTIYDSREDCNAIIETATNSLIRGCRNTVIPNSVISIGDRAFEECMSLTSLTIPNSVTSIGEKAFYCCYSLASIDIPNSVRSIGIRAFDHCDHMTSVTISNSVTSLPLFVFRNCLSLASVTIPSSVTSISEGAFQFCSSLTSIVVPKNVTYIGEAAFSTGGGGISSNLASIHVESGNTVYDSREDCNAIIETASNTLIAGCKNTVIPNSVTNISDQAFSGSSGLTSIIIPNRVKSIGWCSFSHCYSMTDFYCLANVPNTNEFAFFDTNVEDATLHVPTPFVEVYKSAEPWKNFGNIVALPAEMDLISGDVTGSGNVDVQDATIIVNFILGKESSDEYDFSLADMNNDGEVDVFDVTAILNVILSNGSNSALARSFTRQDEERESISLTTEGNGWLLGIDSPERFTSFQFDVEVPQGVDLLDVEWNAQNGHMLQFAKNGENHYAVVAISMASKPLPAFNDALLRLHLSDNGEIRVDNVLFVTPDGKAARFNGVMTGMTNCINGLSNIKGVQIYDISGHRLNTKCEQLSKGVYIINNKKVVIR